MQIYYEELKPYIKVFDYRKYNLIDPIIKPKQITLEDIDRAIVDCYRQFYMGKLHEILQTSGEFKKLSAHINEAHDAITI